MNLREVLILIFEKEIGLLRSERVMKVGDSKTYELVFVYKGINLLKVLLIEITTNKWFIYHDLSKENPILLRKIVYLCERIKRIKESNNTSFTLSGELLDVEHETFVKTVLKCTMQNLFNNFTLFRDVQTTKINIQHKNEIGKVKADL
jgi:hypothetical protein